MTIISADELATRIGDPDLVVCDVRHELTDLDQGRREYDAGHLPGAVFLDLHTELAVGAPAGTPGGRHPLPAAGDFTGLLGRNGITPDTFVVAYDSAGGAIASRLWWMLRSIGHRRVAVLDGGVAAWTAAGHPLVAEVPVRTPTAYPAADRWAGTVNADEVAAAIGDGVTVVDSRSADRYRGETETIDLVAGHVPGAVNRFHGDVAGADGQFLAPDVLAGHFDDLGPEPVVYCGSGVTACRNLLAMEIAGIGDARLYPGSWSDWCSDPARSVVTGAEPGSPR